MLQKKTKDTVKLANSCIEAWIVKWPHTPDSDCWKGAIHLCYQRRHSGIHQSPRSLVVLITGEIARSPSPHGELALQTSVRVWRRGAWATLTRRSCLIWLFHLPTSCRPVRLLWHSNWQFAARTHTLGDTWPRVVSGAHAQSSPVWLWEIFRGGNQPIKTL